MKDGSLYSERVKKRFAHLPPPKQQDLPCASASPGQKPRGLGSDPLYQMAAAILGAGEGEAAGFCALELILAEMIDWNEMRVCSPADMAAIVGHTLPQAQSRCEHLRRALNDVFQKEGVMSLDRLRAMKLRDARMYLVSLDAVDGFAAASVVVWSLGGHAIPVDEALLEGLRQEELVHPDATREEVQAFLERAISASQAKSFCAAARELVDGGRNRAATVRERASSARGKSSGAPSKRGKDRAPTVRKRETGSASRKKNSKV